MNTETPLSCPFCGCPGEYLHTNIWSLDDGEVDAYECPVCFAGAPEDSWNKRIDHGLAATPGSGPSVPQA